MASQPMQHPWSVVMALIEHFEEALVIMMLFENRERRLLANGRPLEDAIAHAPVSERALAEWLADRMRQLEGGDWTYSNFYAATRALEPSPDEIRTFLQRCSRAGVRLHYDDGSDPVEFP